MRLTTRKDFDRAYAEIESKFRNADAPRRCPLSFGDNPRPKLAGLLLPKTWPRPRDCGDYTAVTHVTQVGLSPRANTGIIGYYAEYVSCA